MDRTSAEGVFQNLQCVLFCASNVPSLGHHETLCRPGISGGRGGHL